MSGICIRALNAIRTKHNWYLKIPTNYTQLRVSRMRICKLSLPNINEKLDYSTITYLFS